MVKLIVMIMVIIITIKPIINLALINTRELEKFEWLKLIPRNRDFSFKKFFLTNMLHDNILSLILFLAAMFIARKNIILAKDL